MVTIRNTVKVTVLWTSVVGIAVGIVNYPPPKGSGLVKATQK